MAGAEHYFSANPRSRRRRRTVALDLQDISADLSTDRGIFSAARIDPGTRLLLKHAPLPEPAARGPSNRKEAGASRGSGRILADVGCGYGPIAVTLALRAPDATIWATDVNQRARELAVANLVAAGVPVAERGDPGTEARARVCAPEDVPAALRVDGVYCNPPVHIGKVALDGLLLQWLDRLREGGFAVVVIHKNLGADSLVRRLEAKGWAPLRIATGGGYRVLRIPAAGDR